MPLTNRERWGRWLRILLPPVLVGILIGLTGPFGTYTHLSLADRLFYWVSITSANWLLCALALRQLERQLPDKSLWQLMLMPVLASILVSFPATAVVDFTGRLVSPPIVMPFGSLYWKVLLLCILITSIGFAVRTLSRGDTASGPRESESQSEADGENASGTLFFRRFAPALSGELLALESEDHYLSVHTTSERRLILCRLQDAEGELGSLGIRVHRSWWVAEQAVIGSKKDGGRYWLQLRDGTLVPISRNRVKSLKAKHWL